MNEHARNFAKSYKKSAGGKETCKNIKFAFPLFRALDNEQYNILNDWDIILILMQLSGGSRDGSGSTGTHGDTTSGKPRPFSPSSCHPL